MQKGAILAVLVTVSLSSSVPRRGRRYAISPLGLEPQECSHLVPSGSKLVELPDRSSGVSTASGHVYSLPACPAARLNKTLHARRVRGLSWSGLRLAGRAQSLTLEGFDSFRMTITVPNLPVHPAKPLLFSAGLQNQPFLPLANGSTWSPAGPFGHFGAVLQYPGDTTEGWALTLRLTTRTSGSAFTTARPVHPGQSVDVQLHRAGPRTWVAEATVRESGERLRLLATNPRLQVLPWAVLGVSGGDLSHCDQLPRGLFATTNIQLRDNDRDDADGWEVARLPPARCRSARASAPRPTTVLLGRAGVA